MKSEAKHVLPLGTPIDVPRNPWRSMDRAPKDCTWVEVKVCFPPAGAPRNGDPNQYPAKVFRAHWADGGGEEQPPFRGWFQANISDDGRILGFVGIPDPYAWRPILEPLRVRLLADFLDLKSGVAFPAGTELLRFDSTQYAPEGTLLGRPCVTGFFQIYGICSILEP